MPNSRVVSGELAFSDKRYGETNLLNKVKNKLLQNLGF